MMKRYKNLNGDSGVTAYEISPKSICVRFDDGGTYLYSYRNPGADAVEAMKKLAARGRGLATYINIHVRKAYDRKIA
jgi:hypothetical protein